VPPVTGEALNVAEWVTFARAQDADQGDGLVLVDDLVEVK
jgi:hypothetical protein